MNNIIDFCHHTVLVTSYANYLGIFFNWIVTVWNFRSGSKDDMNK